MGKVKAEPNKKAKNADFRYLVQKGDMWYVVLRINGKKVWHKAGPDPEDARKLRNRLLVDLDNNDYSYSKARMPYAQFLDETFLPWVKAQRAISTYDGYKGIVELHLKPSHLGKTRLDGIKPLVVFRYLKSKQDDGELSNRTIREHQMVIRSSLRLAKNLGVLAANPLRDMESWSFEEKEFDLPAEEEVAQILQHVQGTRYWLPAVISMASTPRRGEELGAQWQRLDWDAEGMYINKTMYASSENGIKYQRPKTKRSKRPLALPHSVMLLLAEHKREQDEQKARLGNLYQDNDLIFCNLDGTPINPDTFSSGWCRLMKRLVKQHGLPYMRFHDFRHYSIDTMYSIGIDEPTVMRQAGHVEKKTTRGYSHPDFDRQKNAVERADDKLRKLRELNVVEVVENSVERV
ncbi:MAG: site-specific integrase [Peptococcaceae bacterium]|jgi:integrase|nr:site-specific integrase [Peptococcaceae bacterium]